MKKYLIVLICAITVSCGDNKADTYPVYVCNCEQRDKVIDFLEKTISDANNMSDEEMEDVIIELRETAYKTICGITNIKGNYNSSSASHVFQLKKDSCNLIMGKADTFN